MSYKEGSKDLEEVRAKFLREAEEKFKEYVAELESKELKSQQEESQWRKRTISRDGTQICFEIDSRMKKLFKIAATKNSKTISELIRQHIETYIGGNQNA